MQKVKEAKNADEGFNAATETYEDLVKAGVIDPAKVVRNALQNASSIASLLLTTEALVSEIPGGEEGRAGDAGRRRHGRDVLDGLRPPGFRLSGFRLARAGPHGPALFLMRRNARCGSSAAAGFARPTFRSA